MAYIELLEHVLIILIQKDFIKAISLTGKIIQGSSLMIKASEVKHLDNQEEKNIIWEIQKDSSELKANEINKTPEILNNSEQIMSSSAERSLILKNINLFIRVILKTYRKLI